ncbi:TetR/AcrR family transcriptional regulator [Serinibacter salmoneus]|uniref:TetR family transcriptional regulator n=1 Tax=Serinibacter salmoneus TaxID=556530 RepID=A0A2A9CYI0_9MICO|nr:TetR/AcrR family transcriptional regulator C-terminal domain-containing protein [Serinibacter salmoneus]PFG18670.1 TetR family transcriptional regulator [Serinibacter salmoneus]
MTTRPPEGSLEQQIAQYSAESGFEAVEATPEERRRLDLLWGTTPPAQRGRPPKFTLRDVVAAGLAVADAEGLAGVSMRRVAKQLGAGAMSLYTYVPGREELVDLMIDAAFAQLDLPEVGVGWREGLVRYADTVLAMYRAHPWLLDLNQWRLPLAPHVLDAEEAALRILASTPLEPAQVVGIRDILDTYVAGLARQLATEQRDAAAGTSQEAYWTGQSHFWTSHFDPERYPTMTRMWTAGAFDVDRGSTELALAPLLDSIERAIQDTE